MEIRIKNWGYEEIIYNAEYCGKKLYIRPNCRCSMHYHKLKHETFYVAKGVVFFESADETKLLYPGQRQVVPQFTRHRFSAVLGDATMFEFSTNDIMSDSYRDTPSGEMNLSEIGEMYEKIKAL